MKRILFGIFILALTLRIAAVITQKESERLPQTDAKQYDTMAINIMSGNGLSEIAGQRVPTAIRTPAYPLYLAGIYLLFGHSYIAVKIIQTLLGALLCIIIYFISYLLVPGSGVEVMSIRELGPQGISF